MSKMTKEIESVYVKELTMEFVEFLEMIVRVAHIKYSKKDISQQNLKIEEKVGFIIDELLAGIGINEKHT